MAAEQDGVIWSSNFSFCSSLPSKSAALSYLPSPFVHNVKAATFKPEPTVTTLYWMYFLFVCLFFFSPFQARLKVGLNNVDENHIYSSPPTFSSITVPLTLEHRSDTSVPNSSIIHNKSLFLKCHLEPNT